jgi:hypothetical protein
MFIACNASGGWIQLRLAIHDEPVMMMAMTQFQPDEPPTTHRPQHGKRVPMVEIANDFD